MAGDTPGKGRGAKIIYACLGTAFILNAAFFTADHLVAQQATFALASPAKVVDTVDPQVDKRFNLRIFKETDRIKLKGNLPTEEDHKTVLGLVKAAFPTTDLSDRIKLEEKTDKTTLKVGGITFALKALTHMETGMALVDDDSVSLEGKVETAAAHDEVRKFIRSSQPTGVVVKAENIQEPPKDFTWRAELKEKKIRILGEVPSKENREILQERVKMLFKGVQLSDQTAVSEGAPENWAKAASHSLEVLQLLKSGFILMEGESIRVEGVATSEDKLIDIDRLASKYPSGFSLESHVKLPHRSDANAAGVLSLPHATALER
ncbi:MAG: hypothetical protein P8Y67_06925 [Alphaproteobacteria bacterium]